MELRQGVLKVGLNLNKRDNYGFIDQLTNTNLSIKNPISEDLNQLFFNRKTNEKMQLDISEIKRAVNKHVLVILEGNIEGIESAAPTPKLVKNITTENMKKWNEFVTKQMVAEAQKNQ